MRADDQPKAGTVVPREFAVTLRAEAEVVSGVEESSRAAAIAEAMVVETAAQAEECNEALKATKARYKRLEEWRARMAAPAKTILANAMALFDPGLKSLAAAETIYKQKLLAFTTKEQEREARERREREEKERVAREEQAKAQAAADAKAKEAEEARQRAAKAREEGNSRSAAALERSAREKAADEAAIRASADAKVLEAASKTVVPAAAAPTGFGSRENFVPQLAEGVPGDAQAIRMIAAALEAQPDLVLCLALDWTYLRKLAKLNKKSFKVPGLVAVDRPVGVSR